MRLRHLNIGLSAVLAIAVAAIATLAVAPPGAAQRPTADRLDEVVADILREPPPEGFARTGTGFFITPEGYILTASHVAAGCPRITIVRNGDPIGPARLIAVNTRIDAAVLKMDRRVENFLPVSRDNPATQTILLFTGARSKADPGRFIQGRIGGQAMSGDVRLFEVTPGVEPGASGGPAIDERGVMVGLIVARSEVGNGRSYVTPAREVVRLLDYIGIGPNPNWVPWFQGQPLITASDLKRIGDATVRVDCR